MPAAPQIAAGQTEILSLIHEQQPVVDLGRLLADGTTYLVRAVLSGTLETVRWLLAQPEVRPSHWWPGAG